MDLKEYLKTLGDQFVIVRTVFATIRGNASDLAYHSRNLLDGLEIVDARKSDWCLYIRAEKAVAV